jgi:hypothetical protein
MHGSRIKIPCKQSRPYIYDVKFVALVGAPYIYDISKLRVNKILLTSSTHLLAILYHILPRSSDSSNLKAICVTQQIDLFTPTAEDSAAEVPPPSPVAGLQVPQLRHC